MLTEAELALVDAARRTITGVAPNDDEHTVAAAAYDSDGALFTGVNVFHFTGGPCAEPVAIGNAAASGAPPLSAIVAVAVDGRVLPPCGRCRQLLFDYYRDIRVVVHGKNGLVSMPVAELLPNAYDPREGEPDAVPPLYLHEVYLGAVRSGGKRSTVRVHDPARTGPVRLVFEHADQRATTMRAEITEIVPATVAELGDEDAIRDGFADRSELRAALNCHYPGITDATDVDVVHFRFA